MDESGRPCHSVPTQSHRPPARTPRQQNKTKQGALTQDVFYPGQRLRVWAMEVDRDRNRLKLTGERPRSLPRVDYSWFLGGEEVEPQGPAEGRATYAGAGGGMSASYEDGRGLQPRGRGKKAFERMQEWQLGGRAGKGRFDKGEKDAGVVYDLDAIKAARDEEEEEEK
jgi:hypothetical protein